MKKINAEASYNRDGVKLVLDILTQHFGGVYTQYKEAANKLEAYKIQLWDNIIPASEYLRAIKALQDDMGVTLIQNIEAAVSYIHDLEKVKDEIYDKYSDAIWAIKSLHRELANNTVWTREGFGSINRIAKKIPAEDFQRIVEILEKHKI